MLLGRLINFVAISGIFSKKDEELDLLPPPPPFPDISKEHERIKDFERIRKIEERREKRELEKKRKQEEMERKKAELKRKKLEELEHRNKKLREERKRAEEEKRRQRELKLKKEEKEKELERKRKLEEEKQRKAEIKRKGEEKLDLLGIAPKPAKEKIEGKLEMPELKFPEIEEEIAETEDIIKADEEIQKAISGMKKTEKPSILKGLFRRKKEQKEKAEIPGAMPEFEEKIETPEIMPRTYDKIDYVEMIEEKIHKARLLLMDFKFDDAKRVYIEIMRMYNELEPKKKSKVYQDIKDLYYERKSAEKFSK